MKGYGFASWVFIVAAFLILAAVAELAKPRDMAFWYLVSFGALALVVALTFVFIWRREKRKEIDRARQVEQWQDDVIDRFTEKHPEM